MEGIETVRSSPPSVYVVSVSRCPDMEGIETSGSYRARILSPRVSRCPDMEGIETSVDAVVEVFCHVCVSRCPDMEGIETMQHVLRATPLRVSVGAPTWRGLKHSEAHLSSLPICFVSVGAPTWRGLKRASATLLISSTGVSRCPDMEGIETGRTLSRWSIRRRCQ